nr:MAG TPA: hypothetical protein [Caudoviricetes sp.]
MGTTGRGTQTCAGPPRVNGPGVGGGRPGALGQGRRLRMGSSRGRTGRCGLVAPPLHDTTREPGAG